jgi:hypothetical protein
MLRFVKVRRVIIKIGDENSEPCLEHSCLL